MEMVDERGANYEAQIFIKRLAINDIVSLMSRYNWPKRKPSFYSEEKKMKNEILNITFSYLFTEY
jgi:hypothetical protein